VYASVFTEIQVVVLKMKHAGMTSPLMCSFHALCAENTKSTFTFCPLVCTSWVVK